MRNMLFTSAIALTVALSSPAIARPMTEVDLATLKRVGAPAAETTASIDATFIGTNTECP